MVAAGNLNAHIATSIAVLLGETLGASGAPPKNADPALAPWFQSLQVPGTNHSSCCSQSDCRAVEYRIVGDHYEALVTPADFAPVELREPLWIRVPFDRILQHVENPIGKAVLCWQPGLGVLCFVRPDEG